MTINHKSLRYGLVILASAPLLIYLAASFSIRYHADDFCLIGRVHDDGILSTAATYYMTWAGAYGTFTVMGVEGSVGLGVEPIAFVLLFVLWWGSVFGLMRHFLQRQAIPDSTLTAATGTSMLCTVTLITTPNVVQSLYWLNGRVAYFLPMVLIIAFFGAIVEIQGKHSQRPLFFGFLGLFFLWGMIIAGLHIRLPSISHSMVFILLAGGVFLLVRKTSAAPYLFIGVLGGVLGTAIFYFAPGNAIRASFLPPPNIGYTITSTLISPGLLIAGMLHWMPLALLAFFVLPFLYAHTADTTHVPSPKRKVYLRIIPIAIILCTMATFAPGFYGLSEIIPGRIWILPIFIMCFGGLLWFYLVGHATRRHPPHTPSLIPLILPIIVLTIMGTISAIDLFSAMRKFAEAWDARDQQLRTAQTKTISTVSFQGVFGFDDLTSDSDFWVNRCMANYYDLETIYAAP
ncbi:MAG TPA: DUF6056 family protein [Aggregatilineales bacterium]|nr:DUF6056 family protein [Aggregatilineales bacterium]